MLCVYDSLMATIKKERPDLFNDKTINGIEIPTEMPENRTKSPEWVEGIGEPINACLLSETNIDPTGWFYIYFISIYFNLTIIIGGCLKNMME